MQNTKKYLIFDLDWTLIKSSKNLVNFISNYLCDKYNLDLDELLYFFKNNQWVALKTQILEFMKVDEKKADEITKEIYKLIRNSEKAEFYEKVPEKIKELSKNYKLFLSTGNSTLFAKDKLKEAGIIDCFHYILWSDIHLKWEAHIEIFKDFICDEDFEKYSVFIWDWQKDREIANIYNMEFIHIDENLKNIYNDKYEINSVANIDEVLKKMD